MLGGGPAGEEGLLRLTLARRERDEEFTLPRPRLLRGHPVAAHLADVARDELTGGEARRAVGGSRRHDAGGERLRGDAGGNRLARRGGERVHPRHRIEVLGRGSEERDGPAFRFEASSARGVRDEHGPRVRRHHALRHAVEEIGRDALRCIPGVRERGVHSRIQVEAPIRSGPHPSARGGVHAPVPEPDDDERSARRHLRCHELIEPDEEPRPNELRSTRVHHPLGRVADTEEVVDDLLTRLLGVLNAREVGSLSIRTRPRNDPCRRHLLGICPSGDEADENDENEEGDERARHGRLRGEGA